MIAQLDTKTVYSFMESMVSIEKYVSIGKEYGYRSLGIMDVDESLWSLLFHQRMPKTGNAAFIRLEMTVHHKEEMLNLRFLALSNRGYQNLMKLSSLKMTGKKNGLIFFLPRGYLCYCSLLS